MANLRDAKRNLGLALWGGTRISAVLVVASILVLSAKEEKERAARREEPARKVEAAKEGRVERAAPSRAEGQQEQRQEGRRSSPGEFRDQRPGDGGMVRHDLGRGRELQVERPGGRVIVAPGAGRDGFVQRPLTYRGQAFVQRTYVVNGRPQAQYYRPWSYGGRVYPVYAPVHTYRPAFYTWAYTPWERPVAYRWGWQARPWYGYYGGYFTPYPVYLGPSFWLADFVIASTLEAAYLAQEDPASVPPMPEAASTMTPEAKQGIANEVRRQMDQERADQVAGQVASTPPLFSDLGPRVFLVPNRVRAYAGSQECWLSEGDVISLLRTPVPGAEWGQVRVMSSRDGSCPRGTVLSVATVDLQEMQNHLQATIDQGLDKLQADQGTHGLPALPSGAAGRMDAPYAQGVQPDDQALDALSLAGGDADRTDPNALNQPPATPQPAATAPGRTVTLGMAMAQVVEAMGQPRNIVDLGARQIYLYGNLKVTFLNGRVASVE